MARAKFCTGFFCSFRGLMFTMSLSDDEGLIFKRRRESRLRAGIHSLGMRYTIAIVWLDRELTVVDTRSLPPWRAACVPVRAAKYIIEALPDTLHRVAVGDRLVFDEVTV